MSGAVESSDLRLLVQQRIDRWRAGETPDAGAMLDEYPELGERRSLVLDLVAEEYCLRKAAGDDVVSSRYCERFPDYHQSLVKLLEVENYFFDQCPQFATTPDAARWPVVGDEFFGFEIVEPLGRGGLARVFLARETAVARRLVVIKVSRDGSGEAQALGRLSHPNIVPILSVECDEDAGWTVICMPLLGVATGLDLLDAAFSRSAESRLGGRRDATLIRRIGMETRPLEVVPRPANPQEIQHWRGTYPEAIARIGLHLAEALEHAHGLGVAHRDIKPSNVLLAWSGRPMLLDFNLATHEGSGGERVGGTLAYMAPELIGELLAEQGNATKIDPRWDIYSLGVVLYELLAGRLPLRPDEAEQLPLNAYEPWLMSKRQPVPTIRATSPEVDERLEAIILKCLSFDAAGRYATAAELAADLREYVSPRAVAGRFAMRNRRWLIAAAVVAVLSGGSLATYVSSQPTQLERLYQRGLSEYDRGDHGVAADTFTKCLHLESGWPPALFGRAQALRQLEKWREARTDYLALENSHEGWAHALAGYCSMKVVDDAAAEHDCRVAHKAGLRDTAYLLNYARLLRIHQRHVEATKLYGDVLEQQPNHDMALRQRGISHRDAVVNDKKKIPDLQGLDDARRDCVLHPDSFESYYYAAVVIGEAARKDATYEEEAVRYLTTAFRQGLPMELIKNYKISLTHLLAKVDQAVIAEARHDSTCRLVGALLQHHSTTPRWNEFLQAPAVSP